MKNALRHGKSLTGVAPWLSVDLEPGGHGLILGQRTGQVYRLSPQLGT